MFYRKYIIIAQNDFYQLKVNTIMTMNFINNRYELSYYDTTKNKIRVYSSGHDVMNCLSLVTERNYIIKPYMDNPMLNELLKVMEM